jgi:hypothetical protein
MFVGCDWRALVAGGVGMRLGFQLEGFLQESKCCSFLVAVATAGGQRWPLCQQQ